MVVEPLVMMAGTPVSPLLGASTQVPGPVLVREVAPPLSPMTGTNVLVRPADVAASVKLRVPLPISPNDPVLVKFKAPVPAESTVLLPVVVRPSVKRRSVLTPLPVYCRSPVPAPVLSPKTRLAAALDEAPMLLLAPPSPILVAIRVAIPVPVVVPLSTTTPPLKVLAAVRFKAPVPATVSV